MTVASLRRKTAKGVPAEQVSEIVLVAGYGIEGDVNAGKPDRQVCLISAASSRAREPDGLCSPRFQANLETDGAPSEGWTVGSRWRASGAVIEIVRAGKDCYPECAVFGRSGPCALARECAFAAVVGGGTVRVGDYFRPL